MYTIAEIKTEVVFMLLDGVSKEKKFWDVVVVLLKIFSLVFRILSKSVSLSFEKLEQWRR